MTFYIQLYIYRKYAMAGSDRRAGRSVTVKRRIFVEDSIEYRRGDGASAGRYATFDDDDGDDDVFRVPTSFSVGSYRALDDDEVDDDALLPKEGRYLPMEEEEENPTDSAGLCPHRKSVSEEVPADV